MLASMSTEVLKEADLSSFFLLLTFQHVHSLHRILLVVHPSRGITQVDQLWFHRLHVNRSCVKDETIPPRFMIGN